MIWRFADAPPKLRSLHVTSGGPDWLVFLPRSMQSADVEEEIVRGAICVARHHTTDGGIVFIGMASIGSVANDNAALSPSAAALQY